MFKLQKSEERWVGGEGGGGEAPHLLGQNHH